MPSDSRWHASRLRPTAGTTSRTKWGGGGVAFVALAAGSVCSFPQPQGQTLLLPADETVVEGQAQTMRAAAAAAAEARLGLQSTVSESEGGGGSGDPASLSQELNTQQLLAHEPRSEPLPTADCEPIGNRPPTQFVPGQVVHVKFNIGWYEGVVQERIENGPLKVLFADGTSLSTTRIRTGHSSDAH